MLLFEKFLKAQLLSQNQADVSTDPPDLCMVEGFLDDGNLNLFIFLTNRYRDK